MKLFNEIASGLREAKILAEESKGITTPPPTLLFRRKAIRQYPDNKKVALYYNDKADKYISIPFEGNFSDDDKNVPVTEENHNINIHVDNQHKENKTLQAPSRKAALKNALDYAKKKYPNAKSHHVEINESVKPKNKDKKEEKPDHIMLMHKAAANKMGSTRINFKDGSAMNINAATATAILNVHGSLKKEENKLKMAKDLSHSKGKFLNLANFCHGVHSAQKETGKKK